MEKKYIKNWGVYVGAFDLEQLNKKEDKKAVAKLQEEYPELTYVNTKEIKDHGVRKLAIYICTFKDFKVF